jgi:hypothetical protein
MFLPAGVIDTVSKPHISAQSESKLLISPVDPCNIFLDLFLNRGFIFCEIKMFKLDSSIAPSILFSLASIGATTGCNSESGSAGSGMSDRAPDLTVPDTANTPELSEVELAQLARYFGEDYPADLARSFLSPIQDIGNGVFVFPSNDFAELLAVFQEQRKDLELVCMAQGADQKEKKGYNAFSLNNGMIVVCKKRDGSSFQVSGTNLNNAGTEKKYNLTTEEALLVDRFSKDLAKARQDEMLKDVKDIGGGVFVFPNQNFPKVLSTFIEVREDLECLSISQGPDRQQEKGYNAYSLNDGMIVAFRNVAETR